MKKYCFFLSMIAIGYVPFSKATSPPSHCLEGTVFGYSGSTILTDSFLETVVDDYLLIGQDITVKGDGAYLIDSGKSVDFYDSVNGFVGNDEANSEGNAYMSYTITNSSAYRGNAWIWTVESGTSDCSKKQVNLQKAPSLNIDIVKDENTTSDGGVSSTFLTIDANPWVDTYSKAYQEFVGHTLNWYYRHSLATGWQLLATNTDIVAEEFYHAVTYFRITLNDGTYEIEEQFNVQTSKPGTGANPCNSKPWLDMC